MARPFQNLEFAPSVALQLNAYKPQIPRKCFLRLLAFTAFDCECPTRESEAADFVGMLTCMRRSFFGSRQLTCGSMSVASTRSRYFMAMFMRYRDRVDATLMLPQVNWREP